MRNTLLHVVGLLCSVLVSCTVNPTVARKADGSYVATTGGNILGRSKGVATKITMPDGVTIEHKVYDTDNTAVATNYLGYKLTTGVVASVTDRFKSADKVKAITEKGKADALVKGTKDPNVIPLDPNAAAAAPVAKPSDASSSVLRNLLAK